MKKIIPTLVGLATICAVGFGLSRLVSTRTELAMERLGETDEPRILPVEAAPLRYQESFTASRRFTGTVSARRRAELSFEGTGRVASILVDDGDGVLEGAPLAQLDVRQLRARRAEVEARRVRLEAQLQELVAGPRPEVIDAAEANVEAILEELNLAARLLERRTELAAKGSISAEQLDTARAAVKTIEARLAGARAALQELNEGTREETIAAQRGSLVELDAGLAAMDVQISNMTLVAPFSGTIEARHLDEGAVVSQQMPRTAFVLSETAALEARIGLPGALVPGLCQDPSTATLTFNGQPIGVASARALPVVDSGTRTITVVLSLSEGTALVRPGDIVTLEVSVEQTERGAWLPIAALSESQRGLWSVFVVEHTEGGAQVVQRAELEVLHVESDRAFVRGTVEPGAAVVVSGAHRLTPGQTVSTTTGSSPQAARAAAPGN
ncbi:MAG: biotin/lipoyl-binding protein [Planctomycetes bacterium]|nr:biotin/lipoyl-binding protein [Planctomycetota bacterium]